MDIREFRCCNYVHHCEDGLTRIELGDFELIHDGSRSISEYSGIPITKEWIENFGFKIHSGREGLLMSKGAFSFDVFSDFSVCLGNSKRINFVHQLQNLYYASYFEELELKN